MIDGNLFLNNIIQSCKDEGQIDENGMTISFLDRIIAFFNKISAASKFESACKTLSEQDITSLTPKQRLKILIRFKDIHSKLRNQERKEGSANLLKQIEENFFKDLEAQEFSSIITKKLTKPKWISFNGRNRKNYRLLKAFTDHYQNDTENLAHLGLQLARSLPTKPCPLTGILRSPLTELQSSAIEHLVKAIAHSSANSESKLSDAINAVGLLLRYYFGVCIYRHRPENIIKMIQLTGKLLDSQPENKEFIAGCFEEITKSLSFLPWDYLELEELLINDFLIFEELFEIADRHLAAIDQSDSSSAHKLIALNLRIKLANLPCLQDREKFPHVYLTKKAQVKAICISLQTQEREMIDNFIQLLKNQHIPSNKDLKIMAKLLDPENTRYALSLNNNAKLKFALIEIIGEQPIDWSNNFEVKNYLKKYFLQFQADSDLLVDLKRLLKTKAFFSPQLNLNEDEILIPLWYHATPGYNVFSIINKLKIMVTKGGYRGAWVSSQWQKDYGPVVYAFDSRIFESRVAHIYLRHQDRRWRGLQQEITFVEPITNRQNLAFVGIKKPSHFGKVLNKAKITHALEETGIPKVSVFYDQQANHIQKTVRSILGNPNMRLNVW